MPHSECEEYIQDLLRKERKCKQNYFKYIKMYLNNDIKCLKDIRETLLNTYEKENNALKFLFSFGYVPEKLNPQDCLEVNFQLGCGLILRCNLLSFVTHDFANAPLVSCLQ